MFYFSVLWYVFLSVSSFEYLHVEDRLTSGIFPVVEPGVPNSDPESVNHVTEPWLASKPLRSSSIGLSSAGITDACRHA